MLLSWPTEAKKPEQAQVELGKQPIHAVGMESVVKQPHLLDTVDTTQWLRFDSRWRES
jgi:hypothetical protein